MCFKIKNFKLYISLTFNFQEINRRQSPGPSGVSKFSILHFEVYLIILISIWIESNFWGLRFFFKTEQYLVFNSISRSLIYFKRFIGFNDNSPPILFQIQLLQLDLFCKLCMPHSCATRTESFPSLIYIFRNRYMELGSQTVHG